MGIYRTKDPRTGKGYVVASRYLPGGAGRYRAYFPNTALAKRALLEVEKSIADGTWTKLLDNSAAKSAKAETIESMMEKFINQRCKTRMKTWGDYLCSLKNICRKYGNVPVKEFSRGDALDYIDYRSKQGVSNATVNREIAALSSMFTYAVNRGVIQANPIFRLEKLKEPEKVNYPLSHEEVDRLIAAQRTPLHSALIGVVAETGLRINEAVQMQWDWVDFRSELLTVPGDFTKGSRNRAIPLSVEALECLRSRVRYFGNPYVWARSTDPKDRLEYPRKAFLTSIKKAGLPHLGFHDLRRYRGTKWHEHGMPVRIIMELLGHKDVDTTLRYLGLSRDMLEKVKNVQEVERESRAATSKSALNCALPGCK